MGRGCGFRSTSAVSFSLAHGTNYLAGRCATATHFFSGYNSNLRFSSPSSAAPSSCWACWFSREFWRPVHHKAGYFVLGSQPTGQHGIIWLFVPHRFASLFAQHRFVLLSANHSIVLLSAQLKQVLCMGSLWLGCLHLLFDWRVFWQPNGLGPFLSDLTKERLSVTRKWVCSCSEGCFGLSLDNWLPGQHLLRVFWSHLSGRHRRKSRLWISNHQLASDLRRGACWVRFRGS